MAMSEWQPINTVPRDASMVDLWSASWGRLTNCRWDEGKWWRARNGYEEYEFDPTHWMPLPAPPKPLDPPTPATPNTPLQ